MVEKLEIQVCEACGVDVRPKALFCYNCGSQVASDEEVQAESANENQVSDVWFKEEIASVAPKPVVEDKPVKAKSVATKKSVEPKVEPAIKLKTAASLREKSKLNQKKTVEVVWEEPQSAPNVWFLMVSIILIAFAVFILFAMLYIR